MQAYHKVEDDFADSVESGLAMRLPRAGRKRRGEVMSTCAVQGKARGQRRVRHGR